MKIKVLSETKTSRRILTAFVFIQFFTFGAFAQAKKVQTKKTRAQPVKQKAAPAPESAVKVTQIDAAALQNLLKPNGKPLLVNFWATWCDPCREEFPDLVAVGAEYQGKIDFITVSLDELSEINRDVPQFLAQMKARMPAYLLKTDDENAAISAVSKDWQGGLPFTILYGADGTAVYSRMGKVKIDALRVELAKLTSTPAQ